MTELDVSGTQITDAGLAHIAKIESLEALNLTDTNVTEEGLAHLTGHPNLVRLSLSARMIGDGSGLQHLIKIPKLHSIGFGQVGESRGFFRFNKVSRLPAKALTAESISHLIALAKTIARRYDSYRDAYTRFWPGFSPQLDIYSDRLRQGEFFDPVLVYLLYEFEFTPGAAQKVPPRILKPLREFYERSYGRDSPALRDAQLEYENSQREK